MFPFYTPSETSENPWFPDAFIEIKGIERDHWSEMSLKNHFD